MKSPPPVMKIADTTTFHNRRLAYGQCFRCGRPTIDCFCAEIPQIANRTNILILQHRRERKHAFNTVKITERALTNCQVLIGYTDGLAAMDLPIQPQAGLLYPGDNARLLGSLLESPGESANTSADESPREVASACDHVSRSAPAGGLPTQLVILDGTWHHTKTFVRDITALHDLPRYRLAPPEPSRYRIREEPTLQSLSTLEATVFALQILEPATAGLNQLIRAFDKMVEQQLANPLNPHQPRIISK